MSTGCWWVWWEATRTWQHCWIVTLTVPQRAGAAAPHSPATPLNLNGRLAATKPPAARYKSSAIHVITAVQLQPTNNNKLWRNDVHLRAGVIGWWHAECAHNRSPQAVPCHPPLCVGDNSHPHTSLTNVCAFLAGNGNAPTSDAHLGGSCRPQLR